MSIQLCGNIYDAMYNLKLILKDTLPVPLVLWQLSKRDRRELRIMIERLTNR